MTRRVSKNPSVWLFKENSMNMKLKENCGKVAVAITLVRGYLAAAFAQSDAKLAEKPVSQPAAVSATAKSAEKIHITFDETNPSIMIVESNGEKVRVDTKTRQIERIADTEAAIPPQVSTPSAVAAPPAAQTKQKADAYAYSEGNEPFDYRLVNVPTPKRVPKGTWNLNFSHRFSQPVNPLSESGKTLLGLDSFSTSSFGVMYGITDKLYINASRSPICQRGLCRTIEIGLGYHITDQNKHSPVALSVYGSMEGDENFSKQYTYNLQMMISHEFGKRVYAFFAPAVHLNANHGRRFDPKPTDYFPPAAIALNFNQPVNAASYGFGALVRITPSVSGVFEFTPRTGFKLGQVQPIFNSSFAVPGFKGLSEPEMGVGIMYSIGQHKFALTFSNTQTTTTSRYNSSNLVLKPNQLVIGFNLFRRW